MGQAKLKEKLGEVISVLVPFYRDTDKLRALLSSLAETGDNDRYEVLVAIDEDDPHRGAAYIIATNAVCRVFTWPRPATLGEKLNKLAAEAKGKILWFIAQDYTVETKGWPAKFREAAKTLPSGIGVLYPHDDLHPDHAAFPILTRKMVETLGYFVPGHFPFWFVDTWIDELGILIGVKKEIDVEVKHQGERGKSHGIVDLQFWAEFFEWTRFLRVPDAVKLLRAAHGISADDPPPQEMIKELDRRAAICAKRVTHLRHPEFVQKWEANSEGEQSAAYPKVKADAQELMDKIKAKVPRPPKVAICIPSSDSWKAKTATDVAALCSFSIASGIQLFICNLQGSMISNSRNGIVEMALQEKCDYLLWLDSDMSVPPNTLVRLLRHNKDVVGATYNKKVPPYETLGKLKGPKPAGAITGGLHEALLLPGGVMLVKADVYRKLKWPAYAECYRWPGKNGLESLKELLRNYLREIPPDDVLASIDETPLGKWIVERFVLGESGENWLYLSEDLFMCRKARRAGYTIWCDLDLTNDVAHLGTSEVTCKLVDRDEKAAAD